MSGTDDVPPAVLSGLRAACLALPEVAEEPAWIGVRWSVRGRTFAHVLTVEDGRPPAFARAAGTEGPAVALTFRAAGPELEVLRGMGPPFFPAPWGADVVGMLLDAQVDWAEITELVTESYLVRAPRVLRAAAGRLRPGE